MSLPQAISATAYSLRPTSLPLSNLFLALWPVMASSKCVNFELLCHICKCQNILQIFFVLIKYCLNFTYPVIVVVLAVGVAEHAASSSSGSCPVACGACAGGWGSGRLVHTAYETQKTASAVVDIAKFRHRFLYFWRLLWLKRAYAHRAYMFL